MSTPMRSLEVTRSAWAAATLAWSRDDAADTTATILLGERMMFAATDHIVGLEALEDAVMLLVSTNGFFVVRSPKVELGFDVVSGYVDWPLSQAKIAG